MKIYYVQIKEYEEDEDTFLSHNDSIPLFITFRKDLAEKELNIIKNNYLENAGFEPNIFIDEMELDPEDAILYDYSWFNEE